MPETPIDPTENQPQPLTGRPSALRQLALQAAALIAVLSLAWPYFGLRGEALPWPESALAVGTVALIFARMTRQPWWWQLIHAFFTPLAWATSTLGIAPGWFLLAFILMLLVYRGAVTGQIPLYFSNAATIAALAVLAGDRPGLRFIDLGAGIGSSIVPLCRLLPDAQLTGIENAPASWLIGWLRTRRFPACSWRMGNFWQISLGHFDLVYAFLSPVPMSALWDKVQREMSPGSLFVSNSFAIPGVDASEIIEVDDTRQTRLYCYRV